MTYLMKKLNYNVYSNISDAEYFSIEDRLIRLESAMAKTLRKKGWRLSETVINNDALVVDYIFKDSEFHGNIGIAFDDLPKQQTFSFYVTKSFDEKRK